jgi:polygalacturonase
MLVFLLPLTPCALLAAGKCAPQTFGAKGDGATKDTHAIQKAIDACASQGGGTVELTEGTYLTGPIDLRSNITLRLMKGAVLLGSSDHRDYPSKTLFRLPDLQPLVSATDAANVAIVGEGTIDGNGESWWQEARSFKDHGILGSGHPRPKLILFDHCHHVRMEGVTVENSPMWQIVSYYTDDVILRNLRILAPQHSPNTDAIDPFASSNVMIDHVFSDVGDDNIAIKSGPINSPGPDSPSRNITITDCTFLHGHGLSVGSELAGGAQNIRAERIHFDGTDNGIRIKANRDRGNDVSDLVFRDIEMKDVKNALIISEYYPEVLPPEENQAHPIGRLTPRFHDIKIENLTATGIGSAGAIVGLPESPIRNLALKNVRIDARKGMTVGYAEVGGEGVLIKAEEGDPIVKLQGAKMTVR